MRFTLAQIRKLQMPYRFTEELDLSEELNGFEDIIAAKPCHVDALLKERGIDTFLLKLSISIDLILVDSISLKEVTYTIETSAEEIYTTDDSIDDAFLIDGQTLDTKEAVLTNILIAKPMSFTVEEEFIDEEEEEEVEEEGEYINPAFASLKDLL